MTDWKPMVYGTLMILLVLFGLFILYNFLVPSDSKVGEFFDEFSNKIFSFNQDQDTLRSKAVVYFEDSFIQEYNSCLDSKEIGCWCTKEKFDIPNGFFLETKQEGQRTTFSLLDNDKGNFKDITFVSESCLDTSKLGGTSILDRFKNQKITIQKGRKSYVLFELNEYDKMSEFAAMNDLLGETKSEVDLSLLFYKVSEDTICIVDKASAKSLEDSPLC